MDYTIKQGDTLASIARKFGTSVSAIMTANPKIKGPFLISKGQTITIPAYGTPIPSSRSAIPVLTRSGQGTYTVQAGDTMYCIAQKNGIALNTLLAANSQIKDPNMIFPGQVINIPGKGSNTSGKGSNTSGQAGQGQAGLTVSAAASLQDVAEELRNIYTRKYPNANINYRFASSGTLQQQIEEGAPVDLFISAGESQMDALSEKGLIKEGSRKDLLSNELVLIAKKDSKLSSFAGLIDPSIARIGIGKPETVPAGMYAKQTLTYLNLWDRIKHKLVYAQDVRQVLASVESGDVDAGLVYRSDALVGENIRTVAVAPAGSHDPILYPLAIIKSTQNQKEAEAFAAFLSSDEAAQVFSKYGFKVLE